MSSDVLPVSNWSQQEQEAWAAAIRSGDIFDSSGLASKWRYATCRLVEQAVGRFLGWYVDHHGGTLIVLPDRATSEAIRSYSNWLRERVAPLTAHGYLRNRLFGA